MLNALDHNAVIIAAFRKLQCVLQITTLCIRSIFSSLSTAFYCCSYFDSRFWNSFCTQRITDKMAAYKICFCSIAAYTLSACVLIARILFRVLCVMVERSEKLAQSSLLGCSAHDIQSTSAPEYSLWLQLHFTNTNRQGIQHSALKWSACLGLVAICSRPSCTHGVWSATGLSVLNQSIQSADCGGVFDPALAPLSRACWHSGPTIRVEYSAR